MIFCRVFKFSHSGISTGNDPVTEICAIMIKDPMARTHHWAQFVNRGNPMDNDHRYHQTMLGCLREDMAYRWSG